MTISEKINDSIEALKAINNSTYAMLGTSKEELFGKKEEQSKKLFEKLDVSSLKMLRVAAIMDEFTRNSYMHECNLLEVTPDNWKKELAEFKPHVLFVESAWEGKDKLWHRKVVGCSPDFFELASYCQEKNIPIIFWNKEDPVYTDQFLGVAKIADIVFTTDIDCIKRYKEELGHDDVYHMHFAAQPKYHNPLEKYERKDKFCFAGAYYHRYPERAKVFDEFAKVFSETKGLDIYDRNYKVARPEHKFPSSYDSSILGKLNPEEIDVAYKGYNYGINMNSINQSQTMFARRVFELLASNTIVVGNYSRGVKNYFGDLTICTDDEKTLKANLDKFCVDENISRKFRLQGLRKVLLNHLYEDRLAYVVKKIYDVDLKKKLPKVNVLGFANSVEEAQLITEKFNLQSYENKELILYSNDDIKGYITKKFDANSKVSDSYNNCYIALFDSNNYYGKNYLLDLMLSQRYGDFQAIGKGSYYSYEKGEFLLYDESKPYTIINRLSLKCSVFNIESFSEIKIEDVMNGVQIEGNNMLCVDEFNFLMNYNGLSCELVDDILIYDTGINEERIEATVLAVKPEVTSAMQYRVKPDALLDISISKTVDVRFEKHGQGVKVISALKSDVHSYMYMKELVAIDVYREDDKLPIQFSGVGDLDLICVCVFYDTKRNKLTPLYPKLNRKELLDIPKDAVYIQFGFRPKGSGVTIIDKIVMGQNQSEDESVFLSRSNVLVLSNQYPSKEALYRNMFVHKRMQTYKEDGFLADVMRMNIYAKNLYSEFENINVVDGQAEKLYSILSSGSIDTVCVHFLDKQMWSVLTQFKERIRIIVWLHGAEIQPWWRRSYNFNNDKELEEGKKASDERQAFWKTVFSEIDKHDLHFVFVSQYFCDEICEDNKIELDKDRYTIIHNCIDTSLFEYTAKHVDMRKKLISIRPYASNKYANDLTVKCIIELSKKTYFDELEFYISGDGELFEETTKPLKRYKNVHCEQRFYRQDEIAELYKKYGIVITPTRMDAQGVSRDEAMSCGCIPITNAVTAIPEFVDENCGILADGENYNQMADGIAKLYEKPDEFIRMSENSAKRVRSQTSKEYTVDRELELIFREKKIKR